MKVGPLVWFRTILTTNFILGEGVIMNWKLILEGLILGKKKPQRELFRLESGVLCPTNFGGHDLFCRDIWVERGLN